MPHTPKGVQRRILGALSLTQVIGGLGNGAGLAIGALLVEDISGSAGLAGLAVTFMMVGAAALTVPLSNLSLRFGRRPALTLGWLIGALGAGIIIVGAVTGSVPLALVGFALFGSSSTANLQSRFAAADRAEGKDVAKSISIVVWSTTVGAVAGPNLTGPGAAVADWLSLPTLAGPMVLSIVAFCLAALSTWGLLRPEPLVTLASRHSTKPRLRDAFAHVHGLVRTAIVAVALSHAVMVGVMALTPVHMKHHEASLSIIGLTISLHIAGMYAASPVFGWLSDAWGAGRTILLGQATLLASLALAGTAGDSMAQITIGLVLLGLGWSASVIAGAALLTAHTDITVRPLVQGLSDFSMSAAGAIGGLAAGIVVSMWSFGALTAVAALASLVVVVAIARARMRDTSHPTGPNSV